MKDNIDLTKILKNCPEGTVFWSDNYGEVHFLRIDRRLGHPIRMKRSADGEPVSYTKEGWFRIEFPASCLLWPSKDCRDWSKFTAYWLKKEKTSPLLKKENTAPLINKEKFDPKTLHPFDRVLVRNGGHSNWQCALFSHINDGYVYPYIVSSACFKYCIPYNDDTKHLVGTTGEAPEYYIYEED